MDHDTAPSGEGFVTLYAGPLDGLVLAAARPWTAWPRTTAANATSC